MVHVVGGGGVWFTWLQVVVCGSRGWRWWCVVHVVGGGGVWFTWLEVVVCGPRGWR